jgi:hypothetical protein
MAAGKDRRGIAEAEILKPGVGGSGAGPRGLPLRLRDYVQIVNSILFLVLGSVILMRVAQVRMSVQAVLIGGGLVVFGIYRLKVIWQYFQRKE